MALYLPFRLHRRLTPNQPRPGSVCASVGGSQHCYRQVTHVHRAAARVSGGGEEGVLRLDTLPEVQEALHVEIRAQERESDIAPFEQVSSATSSGRFGRPRGSTLFHSIAAFLHSSVEEIPASHRDGHPVPGTIGDRLRDARPEAFFIRALKTNPLQGL
jgi:hypothetical protein